MHALPDDVVHEFRHRHAVVESVQQMMVEILLERAVCVHDSESSTDRSSVASSTSCTSSSEGQSRNEGNLVVSSGMQA